MRTVKAMSVVFRKCAVSFFLMLGATSVIFFSLRAAPGTAVDAYSSLSTPIEDIALLRQELGLTILKPLRRSSGGAVVGVELLGAYHGNDEVNYRLTFNRDGARDASTRMEWSEGGGASTVVESVEQGDEIELSQGFLVKITSIDQLGDDSTFEFGAVNLDGRPVRAFYEWLARVAVGDFGKSQTVSPGTPVMEVAFPAFLKTLFLAIGALLGCMGFAVLFVIATPMQSGQSRVGQVLKSIGSAPSFVVGLFVMLVVNQFGKSYWDPSLYIPPIWYPLPTVIENEFVLMPAVFAGTCIVLGDGLFADYLNTFRSEFSSVRSAPFIAAIRSKGASVTRHIVRNLLVPTVDSFAGRLPVVLGSVIIVETMFGLTGGGWYLLEAAKRRDVPLVVGLSVLFTATGILVHLLADVVKTVIDPREADHGA